MLPCNLLRKTFLRFFSSWKSKAHPEIQHFGVLVAQRSPKVIPPPLTILHCSQAAHFHTPCGQQPQISRKKRHKHGVSCMEAPRKKKLISRSWMCLGGTTNAENAGWAMDMFCAKGDTSWLVTLCFTVLATGLNRSLNLLKEGSTAGNCIKLSFIIRFPNNKKTEARFVLCGTITPSEALHEICTETEIKH